MPEIGEIKKGREIGRASCGNGYIWQACLDCGKERWVVLNRMLPQSLRCPRCSFLRIRKSPKARELRRAAMTGINNHLWKGGRVSTGQGYIWVRIYEDSPFFPMALQSHYVAEHRLIMAQSLGRCLSDVEIVHHKNGIKDDNRIENLELVTSRSTHTLSHSLGYRDGFNQGYCDGKNKKITELTLELNRLRSLIP